MDRAHAWTDEQIERIANKMARRYKAALKEARLIIEKSLADYIEEYQERQAQLDPENSLEAQRFELWVNQAVREQCGEWAYAPDGALVVAIAAILHAADVDAVAMSSEALPRIAAKNHDAAARRINHLMREAGYPFVGVRFDLMDEHAARLLMEGYADLLPVRVRRPAENVMWNRRRLYSVLSDSIRKGESIPKMAKRIEQATGANLASSTRAARTACTAAQNLGRLECCRRAIALGIHVRKVWMATSDGRTRDTHRAVDGEVREAEERFSNGCLCPGDPSGAPSEVWNCRCTMDYQIVD